MASHWVVLSEKPFFSVSYDQGNQRVRLARSALKFETSSDVDIAFNEAEGVLAGFRRAKLGLLVDMRQAPLFPPPEVEEVIGRRMTRFTLGFAALAVLVATPSGVLELGRRKREGGHGGLQAYTDEAKALASLDASQPPRSKK